MSTLEVIKLRDIIKVTELTRFVPGLPDTLEIQGEDFSSAETVWVNDVPAPEFVVINKTTAWVQLPEDANQIKTLSVISADFSRTADASTIIFQIGNKSKSISGVLKLVQLFVKILLTTPGSDVQSPTLGGGLQDVVGSLMTTKRTNQAGAAVSRAITTTADQIRRQQLNLSNVPLEERLLAATLLDIHVLQKTDEARARVLIDSVAGQKAVTGIIL